MRAPLLICLTLTNATLAACGGPEPAATNQPSVAPSASATPALPTPTPTPVATASRTEVENKDYDFAYSYPAAAAAVAPLATWLEADRDKLRAALAKDTADAHREMEKAGFPYHPYESTTEWKVVTDTPRFLSLSAETYDYTGGAHGSPGFRALVWDKDANRRLAPTDVFTSPAALQGAISSAFCKRLDAARAQRRGAPVLHSDDPFNQCPKIAETTPILGSTDSRAIDRIGLLVGPYVAGPYAEGSYDLTLPVTPALVEAVKPEYRAAFAVR